MHQDSWSTLKQHTTARIALGRAGGSLPTGEWLRFAADHADARDAVHSELDLLELEKDLGRAVIRLRSQAVDRAAYLRRPDLGRRLDQESADRLAGLAAEPADVVVIVADGLSATAAQRHGAKLVEKLIDALKQRRWRVGPLCAVEQARVAIEDEIGWLLKAKIAVILIGERPGLGSADSLGAYLVYDPVIGRTDAQRNCVSNIHPDHLGADAATATLVWLIEQAMVRQLSGVGLKDESSPGIALGEPGAARL